VRWIPLVELAALHDELRPEIEEAIQAVLTGGRFVGGPAVEAFEEAWASYCGVRHTVGVASGTDALEIGLNALGVGPGDEVVVPAHTFAASAEAVVHTGARPLLADVDPLTFTLDPDAAEAAITPRTAAIMAVHLYGQPADLDGLGSVAERHGLALVEDCAQAHGATWCGQIVGGIGHVGCFSFYPSKNLGAIGNAGAIVTNDAAVATRARAVSHHGQFERDVHQILGRSSRLDDLQAAVLSVKLQHLDNWNAARAALAAKYDEALGDAPGITPPHVAPNATHVYHLYVVRVSRGDPAVDRDALADHLAERGIESRVHYPTPVHHQPAFVDDTAPGGAPNAEAVTREILSVPMYPHLPQEDLERVVAAIDGFASGGTAG